MLPQPAPAHLDAIAHSLLLAAHLILDADARLVGIVALSLRVSFTACCIGALLGLLLGSWLAVQAAEPYMQDQQLQV